MFRSPVKNALVFLSVLIGYCAVVKKTRAEWHDGAGPWVIATRGEIWPKPMMRNLDDTYYRLEPKEFTFEILNNTCDIVVEKIPIFKQILQFEYDAAIRTFNAADNDNGDVNNPKYKGLLQGIEIHLSQPCERYPHSDMDESYTLEVSDSQPKAIVRGSSVWGILHGIESFTHLVTASQSTPGLIVRSQYISDKPKFRHRGLLLDTSRHFLPLDTILRIIDAMSYNKLNVLHWHIVDDNSFPFVSSTYPQLSAKGAYHSSMVYTAYDVKRVIEAARIRGIRVIPEFDTPGHTKSWGQAYPQLLTKCYGLDGKPDGKLGPMDPTNEELYKFVEKLFNEVVQRFPENHLHLGGDEVPFECWASNPEIRRFMEIKNITNDYPKLEEIYVQRVLEIVKKLNVKPIVWQEVFDNNVGLDPGTIVHVWTGTWQLELRKITSAGYPAILSTCWYLDHVSSGGDWLKYYRCDPSSYTREFYYPGNKNATGNNGNYNESLLLGGEACMWGEFVDRTNVMSRIWPRASAVAERLWSHDVDIEEYAAQRLEEHACRMNKRGIDAQPPNGSGFCVI